MLFIRYMSITIMSITLVFNSFFIKEAFADRYYLMNRPRLGIGFYYQKESDELKGPHINTDSNTRTFKERLEIETGGWIYHPALLIYTSKLVPEWEQETINVNQGKSTNTNRFLKGYDFNLTFLQYKPYTFKIFARKNTITQETAFAGRSTIDSTVYGADMFLKYKILPTTLSYTHSSAVQKGFYVSDEDRENIQLYMRHHEKSNDTNLNASYTMTNRATPSINNININKTTNLNESLQNYWSITPDRRFMLNSSLIHRYIESGSTSSSGFGLSERLNWKHSKNMDSNYNISYTKDNYNDLISETKSVGAGISHLLYENLTTSLSSDFSKNDSNGGSQKIYGGKLGFDYRRRIPWGMLNISIGNDYKITESNIPEKLIQVVDESHILKDSGTTFLNSQYVDINSIVVTNNSRTIVYTKDIDYRITEAGSFMRITRSIFGSILDGQEVLVSYKYLSNPAFNYSTSSSYYGVNLYLWSALRINYRLSHSKQDFLSGIHSALLADNTNQAAEAELVWKWTNTRLTFEDQNNSTGISFSKWFAEETLSFRPSDRISFGLKGNYSKTIFTYTSQPETTNGLAANLKWVVNRWSNLSSDFYLNKKSANITEIIDSGFYTRFEWYYGIWRGNVAYRFYNTKDTLSSQAHKNHKLLFEIKRVMF